MNLLRLSLSYIRRRKLDTLLNVVLLSLGVGTIVVLLLFDHQVQDNLRRNAEGIDLVVGAKGSPIQLILSGIYHVDVPTGNIPMREAMELTRHPAVAGAIPLSMGDSYRGFRIVGTTHDYPAHYGAAIDEGALWGGPLEVTLGARVASELSLGPGDEIVSSHGLSARGEAHDQRPLSVVGTLRPTGTVIDRLVLTAPDTFWHLHPTEGPPSVQGAEDGDESGREITVLLIRYSSPLAAAMLPAYINNRTPLQAASPAFETVRLFSMLGVGLDAIRVFGLILVLSAALSLFISLFNALKQRRYDLAVMRALGASRTRLLLHVLLEGLLLALMGALAGLALGHAAAGIIGGWAHDAKQMDLTGWTWLPEEWWVLSLALVVGLLSALVPAIQAYRTEIARTLARR